MRARYLSLVVLCVMAVLLLGGTAMATGEGWFGQANPPTTNSSASTVENVINLGKFTTAAGTDGKVIDSGKAYIDVSLTTSELIESQMMIYKDSDSTLLGSSDVVEHNFGSGGDGVYKWTFTTKPTIAASTTYWIGIWTEATPNNTINLRFRLSLGAGYATDAETFDGTPPTPSGMAIQSTTALMSMAMYYSDASAPSTSKKKKTTILNQWGKP